jgi:hypothetical protein
MAVCIPGRVCGLVAWRQGRPRDRGRARSGGGRCRSVCRVPVVRYESEVSGQPRSRGADIVVRAAPTAYWTPIATSPKCSATNEILDCGTSGSRDAVECGDDAREVSEVHNRWGEADIIGRSRPLLWRRCLRSKGRETGSTTRCPATELRGGADLHRYRLTRAFRNSRAGTRCEWRSRRVARVHP